LVCYIRKYVIILGGDIAVDVPPTKILGDVSPARDERRPGESFVSAKLYRVELEGQNDALQCRRLSTCRLIETAVSNVHCNGTFAPPPDTCRPEITIADIPRTRL